MVCAFIVIENENKELLYSSLYLSSPEDDPENKKFLSGVKERVLNEVRYNVSIMPQTEQWARVPESEYRNNLEATGLFCYAREQQLNEKIVVWRMYNGLTYVLVCEKTENRLLTSRTLLQLIQIIHEMISKNVGSSLALDIKSQADIMTAIVSTYLPNGQLIFANNRVLQQLRKSIKK